MDLLFSKYASPFLLLDTVISACRFSSFVRDFIDAENDRSIREVWLHKVWDKDFAEFRESVMNRARAAAAPKTSVETTIKTSLDILQDFEPAD